MIHRGPTSHEATTFSATSSTAPSHIVVNRILVAREEHLAEVWLREKRTLNDDIPPRPHQGRRIDSNNLPVNSNKPYIIDFQSVAQVGACLLCQSALLSSLGPHLKPLPIVSLVLPSSETSSCPWRNLQICKFSRPIGLDRSHCSSSGNNRLIARLRSRLKRSRRRLVGAFDIFR